ncbi:MAG: hypothetical protein GYB18_12630 [Oceanospirillales bacterium]|nr:hypothetical protein [Oceanospirillales bacterium]
MRRLIIGVVAGMLLPLSPAFAEADATVVSQVEAATQNASTPEQIAAAVEQMLKDKTPEQQQAILTAAMSLYSSNQDALTAIGNAARNANVPTNIIAQAATDAGISSTLVGLSPAPATNSTPVTPPAPSAGGGVSPT